MTFEEYLAYFEQLLQSNNLDAPYSDPEYFNYTKLNWSRLNRWLKTGQLNETIKTTLAQITTPQKWILISEPWCGDAAHIVPFINLIAKENPNIQLHIELRDAAPYRIEQYLTNGVSKSIPILVIKDVDEKDLVIWGPRPKKCQEHFLQLKETNNDMESIKIGLQQWYNKDQGQEIMNEIALALQNLQK